MKPVKKTLLIILTLVILAIIGVYIFLVLQKPQYSGKLILKGLKQQVEIFFDEYGVPHIYGENEEDVYFALGYVHAQERLFQMELVRRVSAGRLSEILGGSTINVDKFFRMLGTSQHAEESAKKFLSDDHEPWQKAALAYLAGINSFIENGTTPLEFRLLSIPKEKYTIKDMYLVVEYTSFNFQMAFRTDPLLSRIQTKIGDKYIRDLSPGYVAGTLKVPSHPDESIGQRKHADVLSCEFQEIENRLPVPIWMGSNAWALSPKTSKSGKVLFANDTHIGYGVPSVWYEAHLEYPGFSFYGNYLAGFPFAPIGHTSQLAWGMTIFENDDLDFFREKPDANDSNRVWFSDHWEDLQTRNEVIRVKDSADVKLTVRSSHHGPVCSDVIGDFKPITGDPVSACWTFLKFPSNLFQVAYNLDHAKNKEEVRDAASQIIAPGLNIIYGDAAGNIAWWAAARLVKRPVHVKPYLLLDGSGGQDEWLGWYDFKDNPQSENPADGFVYSANNQPDTTAGMLYPGYYTPEDRALRITHALSMNKQFSMDDMQQLQGDVISDVEAAVVKIILEAIGEEIHNGSANFHTAATILKTWNGDHQVRDAAPVIYYKLLYHILYNAMADELGEKDFNLLLFTHVLKNSIPSLMKNDSSAWWDDINTKNVTETRKQIFKKSLEQTVSELEQQLGKKPEEWYWGRVHVLEHVHPIGTKKPLNHFFNVGPFPEAGGNETVNQQGFELNKEGVYKIRFGPAMRRVVDFADPENGKSILPTGQSGNVMSKHYSDQAELFINGKSRKEMMDKKEIMEKCRDKLTLQPR